MIGCVACWTRSCNQANLLFIETAVQGPTGSRDAPEDLAKAIGSLFVCSLVIYMRDRMFRRGSEVTAAESHTNHTWRWRRAGVAVVAAGSG